MAKAFRIKTEMHGTGGGRWDRRTVAKKRARKARRAGDKVTSQERSC